MIGVIAVVLLGVVAGAWLAERQAPSRDELLTLAQTEDTSTATLRATYARASPPPAPPAYYGVAWLLGRSVDDPVPVLRAVSIAGWATGGLALGWVVLRRGGGPLAAASAAALPSATGLFDQGMVARPYGLAFGAGAVAIAAWTSTLRSRAWGPVALLGVSIVASVAFHYWMVTIASCLFVAEVRARSNEPARSRWPLVAVTAAPLPIVLAAVSVHRAIAVEQAQVHPVPLWMVPSFYGSILRPLVVPVAVAGVLALVLVGATDALGIRSAISRTSLGRFLTDPYPLLVALLVGTVPLQVVLGATILGNAYLHRYAIGGVAGLALLAGVVVGRLDHRSRPVAAVVLGAILLAVPVAAIDATDRAPAKTQVQAVAADAVDAGADIVIVPEPYLYGALRWTSDLEDRRDLRLGGPSTITGYRSEDDLYDAPSPGAVPRSVVLVADRSDLLAFERAGRATDVVVLDRLPLDGDLSSRRRTLVVARATVEVDPA
ncbi:MAG: hypothetical protein KDA94_00435 [Acidimicrobiales bacterium]|nr:hypothetical protein [Acidimicrobiales bacterium]